MAYLLIVILDDLKVLPEFLQAWWEARVPGATILESVGAYRAHTWLERVGLGALERLFEAEEIRRRTLLTAIDDEALLARAVAEAERVVGGFERPNSGFLLVLPVAKAQGLQKERPLVPEKASSHHFRPGWREMRMGGIAHTIGLEPVTAPSDAMLERGSPSLGRLPWRPGRLRRDRKGPPYRAAGHPYHCRRLPFAKTVVSLFPAMEHIWLRSLR